MDSNAAVPDYQSRRKLSAVFLIAGILLLIAAFVIGISDNPPGITAMLIGGCAVIMSIGYRFTKSGRRSAWQDLLYWVPRALCIAFALFTSLFALDVFTEGQGFGQTVLALLMHLIPTFLILTILALSWRREWIGGVLFIVLALLWVVLNWNRPFMIWWVILLTAGTPVSVGILFLLNWQHRAELRGE
jgi:hypothetical protein